MDDPGKCLAALRGRSLRHVWVKTHAHLRAPRHDDKSYVPGQQITGHQGVCHAVGGSFVPTMGMSGGA